MMNIKKADSFENERIVVLPKNIMNEYIRNPLVNPIYLTDIGYYPDAKYHYRHRPQGSEQHILIYCKNGEGFYYINDKKEIVKKDTFFIIPKGTPHVYGTIEENPWTIYWIHFDGLNARNYFLHRNSELFHLSIEKAAIVISLFNDVLNCLEKGYTLDSIIYVSQVLANLLGTFFFYNHDYKLGFKDEHIRIKESLQYMSEHVDSSLSLKKLAKQANLSSTHYSYMFKKITGFSPIDYFIRLKTQQACKYLDTTNLKINEISRILGFQDPYYFSRVFHKIMQQSPSSYREIIKG